MKKSSKIILNILLFAAIFAFTIWSVFDGENLGKMMQSIVDCDIRWLIPAVFCVFLFIWGESIIIWYMMKSSGILLKKTVCFLFSSIGFFFSCVTPSATGGQPMQIYFMKKERIPIPIATVILLIVTITYKAVLVVIGLGIMFFDPGFLHHYLDEILPVFYLGIFLNVFCVVGMSLLVFHPILVEKILLFAFRLLEKLHILKPKEHRLAKLENSITKYNETAYYMRTHLKLMARVFLITFGQRMALFAVPCFVYKAFRLSGTSFLSILMLQAVISVSVDMLPLPGGMGISENLFLIIFEPIFGAFLLPGMVLSRGIGYYSELLISAVFTAIAVIYFSFKSKKYTIND